MSTSFRLNHRVLSTDAANIDIKGINAHEHISDHPLVADAIKEHDSLMQAFKTMGIQVEKIPSIPNGQDSVFTANWGLTWNGKCLLSSLPRGRRELEEPYAEQALQKLGFETRRASVLFSGQGDALIIDDKRVIIGDGYRTDARVASEIEEFLGLEVTVVKAKPKRNWLGRPMRNSYTGLWDSYFYDIDIAVAVLRPGLIAVCFDALTKEGQKAIRSLSDVEIIPVDLHEARDALATNLVSNGHQVVMVDNAPKLAADLRSRGFELILLPNNELKKGGGGFRCSSLSLYT